MQSTALYTLRAALNSYFPINNETNILYPSLQHTVVIKCITTVKTDKNPTLTCSFSVTLDCLPRTLLVYNMEILEDVLQCLRDDSKPAEKIWRECDTESKRNEILELTTICQALGISDN